MREPQWTLTLEKNLTYWRNYARARERAYAEAAQSYDKLGKALGSGSTAIAAIASAIGFSSGSGANARTLGYIVASLAAVVTILTGIQRALQPAEQSSHSDEARRAWARLESEVEQQLAFDRASRDDPVTSLSRIRDAKDKIEEMAPRLGVRRWEGARKRFDVAEYAPTEEASDPPPEMTSSSGQAPPASMPDA
jgi:hypothetical protein